ncbi:hypothetical protein [Spirosoma sp.]|uniref:hypothetical protein n=1 Tax=Spirosoma sp. TaxID=1899569 RepID=UPI00260DC841|nr:hypothetical protein [Spirosoma sp.]MCX6213002.1 hypothetical protein [Spirosoma sp.]
MKAVSNDSPLTQHLEAKRYYSGFALASDTYNAITAASDGRIYYILSSESYEQGGKMYVYDPQTNETQLLADLTDICGEAGKKAIPQGKSHVRFYEYEGKLYFATHCNIYETIDGIPGLPQHVPDGFTTYPGGHILSYDPATGAFKDLAIAPNGEGILTMTIDRVRGYLYVLTWPLGYLIQYTIATRNLQPIGLTCGRGEAGTVGDDYRVICRSTFVDPSDGRLYLSTAEGDILTYCPDKKTLNKVDGAHLRLDYFGRYDPTRPGSMGYNWRKISWSASEAVAYGVHGNSGYLFRFDPRQSTLTVVERITSEPSKRSGMSDQFRYGYLGFQLGPDDTTVYYLTGGPIPADEKKQEGAESSVKESGSAQENLHLVTYHLPTFHYQDHGPIYYADGTRPSHVNSIAIGADGTIYTLARFDYEGHSVQDLIKISSLLANSYPFLTDHIP